MSGILDDGARRLVLACEIAGYLHDLGKLHPGFSGEMLAGGSNLGDATKASCGIDVAHGAILEPGRAYPDADELATAPGIAMVLATLRADPAWAAALALPDDWVRAGTVQAEGLGAPLRQHHAGNAFPPGELSFLGDLYAFGADIRDSALDKGSGGSEGSNQAPDSACITDAFGHARDEYSARSLARLWGETIAKIGETLGSAAATADLAATRRACLAGLEPLFRRALGETRRPTNDVTLHHHARSTASLFKAAVAEGALRGSFAALQEESGLFAIGNLGRVRFRLLGVRWDWAALSRGMLSPVALVSLSGRRREATDNLRVLFEEEAAVGNIVYEDDDGVLAVVPGFHDDDAAAAEALFARHVREPLCGRIDQALAPLGVGTPFRLCWTEPLLYLSDYPEALGLMPDSPRQEHLQVDEAGLRALWAVANADAARLLQVCPQCGLRPAEARELAPTAGGVRQHALCDECATLADRDARRARSRHLGAEFGFRTTFAGLEELAAAAGSPRVALVSVRVDAGAIALGNALVTQLARPVGSLTAAKDAGIADANALGDWFEKLLGEIRAGKTVDRNRAGTARQLLGDPFWLKENDGRGTPLAVAEGFFLRESAALPAEWGLVRHDGDRLALFAQRKHASPARLQRLWDDLRDLWRTLAGDLAGALDARLLPLTMDAGGFRFAVAAADSDDAVQTIDGRVGHAFARLRGGLAAQVSCVVTRPKFPLYLALDALERLERRIPELPRQRWRVESLQKLAHGQVGIALSTPQGIIHWRLDAAGVEPDLPDPWHPHLLVAARGGRELHGPERIVHLTGLLAGDELLVPPSTFDFAVLEGSGHRHQIAWRRVGDELRRPDWVLGTAGRAPLLLDAYAGFARLLRDAGWDLSRLKGLQGEMIETHEKWVRDVPAALRETGEAAWLAHLRNMLLRYGPADAGARARLLESIRDGRFFDAAEWTTFVSKSSSTTHNSEANA